MRGPLPRLHAITDAGIARRLDLPDIARALAGSAGPALALHARGRTLSGLDHYELALRLAACAPAQLFVNDRLDVALATPAVGVQLAAASLTPDDARRLNADWWIGSSVHDLDEGRAARDAGADYLVLGPVYATSTHAGRPPVTAAVLRAVVGLGVPVIAIGGVRPERVRDLKNSGVHGVAAIRALWESSDPAGAVRHMLQELDR